MSRGRRRPCRAKSWRWRELPWRPSTGASPLRGCPTRWPGLSVHCGPFDGNWPPRRGTGGERSSSAGGRGSRARCGIAWSRLAGAAAPWERAASGRKPLTGKGPGRAGLSDSDQRSGHLLQSLLWGRGQQAAVPAITATEPMERNMTIWEQNLTILRQVAPALAALLERTEIPADHRLSPSRKGPLTLGVGRRQLHSAYDPVREGEAWARSQVWEGEEPVVVFGLGLGYHLLPVIQRQRPVYVVEPSPAVARLALEHQDLRPLLRGNGLRLGRAFRDLPKQARLLAHPPSRRLHPALYQRLGAFLAGVEPDGKLRVLVAGPLHGGSLPIARAVHRALRGLGHETELLDYAPYHPGYQSLREMFAGGDAGLRLEGHFMGFLARVLEERVRGFRPDLLWFLAQAPVTPPLLRRLKQQVPLIAYWFVEDFQVFPYWRDLAPEVDVFFVLQREPFFGELAGLGVKHYAFLPLAADPAIYRPLELTPEERRRYGSALSFVGAGYANRRQFFQGLLDYDLKIWGSEWDLRSPLGPMVQDGGVRVPEAEAVKIFNAGRINLNLHSSPYCRGINPGGDYLNPRVF
ncbi:MAG: hypothetical protein FJ128_12315, partial [Deltaproteobacteria bacterium]|nr:hypothetical protein [Deltaproteobacteria bacterium]